MTFKEIIKDNIFILLLMIGFIVAVNLGLSQQKQELSDLNEEYQQEIDKQDYLIKSMNQTTNNIVKVSLYIEEQLTKSLEEEKRLKQFYIDESRYYRTLETNIAINPRYKDIIDFFRIDKTDENKWDEHSYDCTAFSNDIVKNAIDNNMFMCTVEIQWETGGHIIVAINTSDKGLIYIEPQTDRVIDLHLGKGGHSGFPKETVVSYDSCFERMSD